MIILKEMTAGIVSLATLESITQNQTTGIPTFFQASTAVSVGTTRCMEETEMWTSSLAAVQMI